MSFDDLPPLPKLLHPGAEEYAQRCMAATRKAQAEHRVLIDCRYGTDYWQKLDVYLPADPPPAPLPALLFFHGGAWTSGTKEWMGFMAPALLDAGVIFVSGNYRLAPAARFPEIVDDCVAATAWVRDTIGRHGGDPERLFIGGHSAGGHLAAMVALDRRRRRAAGLPDSAIRACLAVSAPLDIRNRGAAPGSMERRVYDVLLRSEADDAAASPITLIEPDSVPFFVAWGERDFPRIIRQSQAFTTALRAAGAPVETLVFPDTDHFGASEMCGPAGGDWMRIARRWLTAR